MILKENKFGSKWKDNFLTDTLAQNSFAYSFVLEPLLFQNPSAQRTRPLRMQVFFYVLPYMNTLLQVYTFQLLGSRLWV